jgi:hypothetical protein
MYVCIHLIIHSLVSLDMAVSENGPPTPSGDVGILSILSFSNHSNLQIIHLSILYVYLYVFIIYLSTLSISSFQGWSI